jgi:membrane carboxypeptidase/penicillin-binding protein PbpC
MKNALRWFGILSIVLAAGLIAYAASGFFTARADAPELARRADRLIQTHRGAADLGPGRVDQLLLVEDPGYWNHAGVDLSTAGGGLTTLTQSLSKRVGFSDFKPGIRKLRLMGYAVGLESKLSKQQILALYLDTVWMGRGPDGPMAGFFSASRAIYGRPPASLSQREFLTLVAVPIAPRTFDLVSPNKELLERVRRINRLVHNLCQPNGLRDVWLEGCA